MYESEYVWKVKGKNQNSKRKIKAKAKNVQTKTVIKTGENNNKRT
jgi:hypothetical protein